MKRSSPIPRQVKQDRLAELCDLMRSLKWDRAMGQELVERWGTDKAYLEILIPEAWRQVRREVADPDAVTALVCQALTWILKDSLADALNGDAAMHRKIAVDAAKALAAIAAPRPPDVTNVLVMEDKLDDEALVKRLADIAERARTLSLPRGDGR